MNFFQRHPGLVKFLLLLILIVLILYLFVRSTIVPVFYTLAEAEAVHIANEIISDVVDRQVEEIKYKDLITYEVNNNGDIILMQPNIREINKFSSSVSLNIQKKLQEVKKPEINIPLLKVFGFDMIAGLGPDVKARIVPIGFVHPPQIVDSFESAGINQTRHKIYLNVAVKLKLIVPMSQKVTTVNADLPIIEVTILGQVPEIYVGLDGDSTSGIIDKGSKLINEKE